MGAADDGRTWPAVAVVMPVRNEADHLRVAVDAVRSQDYPGSVTVCLAVAPSTDGSEQLAAELGQEDAAVRVVANPAATTPAGLNEAIRATTEPVIVRVDGHSELPPGYVRRAVETMRRTGAVNVGGVQHAVGTNPFEHAVAAAMASRFGSGDAKFHYGGTEGPTDTVYLGVFDRSAIEAVGLYDEGLVRNQDYELNIRLRRAGGVIWFDPQLVVRYRPRRSLAALARQYFEYGQWKREVIRRHPGSLRWRQALPPVAMATVLAGLVVAPRWRPAIIAPAAYAIATTAASVVASEGRPAQTLRLLAVFPTMHGSWAGGFLTGPRRLKRARSIARGADADPPVARATGRVGS